MDREEAIEIIRKNMPSDKSLPVYEALQTIIPELAESEDERTRKWLLDYAIEMIAGLESDISLSNYDGIKGHDPEAEAELAQWQKARAYLEKQKENIEKEYVFRPLAGTDINSAALQAIRKADEGDRLVLAFNGAYIPVRKGCNANKIVDIYDAFIEKQKEPHYTKRNALFDKCVENCDPEVMKKVSDEVDEMLEKEQKLAEHSAKGRRGRMGGIPEHIRKKAENFLSKMEPPYDADDICSAYETGAMENANPSWSEEDEKRLELVIDCVYEYYPDPVMKYKLKDWLNSLPLNLKKKNEDVEKFCSNECSEEDQKIYDDIMSALEKSLNANRCYFTSYDVNFLKLFRPQPKQKVNNIITPKQKFFQWIYDRLVNVHKENPNVDYMISFKRRIEELSLDEPSWKPTEEQMKALKLARSFVVDDFSENPTLSEILKTLQEQLEKLK